MNDTIDDVAEARLRDLRARKALGYAPDLAEHLRAMLYPSDGRVERGIDFRDQSTPLRTEIADDGDTLHSVLLGWVEYWRIELGMPAPSTAVAAWRSRDEQSNVIGFRAGTTPGGARALTQTLSTWLLLRADTIVEHSAAESFHVEVAREVFALRGKYPTSPRPERTVLARPCPVCGEVAVRGDYFGGTISAAVARGEDMLSAVDGIAVRCDACGWRAETRPTQIVRWLA